MPVSHPAVQLISIAFGTIRSRFEQVVLVPPIIDLVVHKFLGGQQRRIGHPLICLRDLDLLLVLMDLFQAVRMTGKLFQLVVEFLLQGNVDLICPLGNDGDRTYKLPVLAFISVKFFVSTTFAVFALTCLLSLLIF